MIHQILRKTLLEDLKKNNFKIKITIIKAKQGHYKIDREVQDHHKHKQLKMINLKMEFTEFNIYKIITSKKLYLDKLQAKELKELLRMRHHYQNMN